MVKGAVVREHQTKTNMNYLAKITAKRKSTALLRYAKELGAIASQLRLLAGKQNGDNGPPNRYPVSGGICDHWPEFAKGEVTKVCREWSATLDESLRLWRLSGCRLATWVAEKEAILGAGISYCA